VVHGRFKPAAERGVLGGATGGRATPSGRASIGPQSTYVRTRMITRSGVYSIALPGPPEFRQCISQQPLCPRRWIVIIVCGCCQAIARAGGGLPRRGSQKQEQRERAPSSSTSSHYVKGEMIGRLLGSRAPLAVIRGPIALRARAMNPFNMHRCPARIDDRARSNQ